MTKDLNGYGKSKGKGKVKAIPLQVLRVPGC
jgi:hypothetical protein